MLWPSSLGLAQGAQSTKAPRSSIADADDEPDFIPSTGELEQSLHQANKRIRRAGIGLGLSAVAVPVGAALITKGAQRTFCVFGPCRNDRAGSAMLLTGTMMVIGGLVGVVASGAILAPARRDKRRLAKALAPTTLRLGPGWVTLTHRF